LEKSGGPWKINSKNYVDVKMPVLKSNIKVSKSSLFRFSSNGKKVGLLSQARWIPNGELLNNEKITSIGINGSGGEFRNCWWGHSSLFIESGAQSNVQLHIKLMDDTSVRRGSRSITIREDGGEYLGYAEKLLKLLETNSETLQPEKSDGKIKYTIPWKKDVKDKDMKMTINFKVEAPIVKKTTLASLPVWHSYSGGSQTIYLPMIILPKKSIIDHASIKAYPGLTMKALSLTDTKTNTKVQVSRNGKEVYATSLDGKELWRVNLVTRTKNLVGYPVVRHLSFRSKGKILAVIGKHEYVEIDLKSGKVKHLGSD